MDVKERRKDRLSGFLESEGSDNEGGGDSEASDEPQDRLDIDSMTMGQLSAKLRSLGIKIKKGSKRPELVELLRSKVDGVQDT